VQASSWLCRPRRLQRPPRPLSRWLL